MFHDGNRKLQDAHETRALADRIKSRARGHVNDGDRQFIERQDMFFLATADAEGRPSCSYRGGDPGFVRVGHDGQSLQWDNYDGDGTFRSLGNTLANPWVELLFVDFGAQKRLRLNGRASLSGEAGALVVSVAVAEVFPNCPRYIHKLELVERSKYVPRGDSAPPEPEWKSADWAVDVMPSRRS